jgi:hypothetical protein
VTAQAWLLLSWTLVGAAWSVTHVVVVWQSLRAEGLGWTWRLLALLPPAAPGVAWAGGHRAGPILWLALVVVYVLLRAAG